MDIFSVIEENAANELVQRAAELPMQPTIMDIANFMGISRSSAYKLVHSEGFPAMRLQGLRRLIISKKLFLDWFMKRMQESGGEPALAVRTNLENMEY